MIDIDGVIEFQWDDGNYEKNWIKHKVSTIESEQIFFNNPLVIMDDIKHSEYENRNVALGVTDNDRLLTVIFTIRNNSIRIISARPMHTKEKKHYYEKTNQKNTEI